MARHQDYHPRANRSGVIAYMYILYCELAATLDTVLNFSKRSRLTEIHHADFERGNSKLPISVEKKTIKQL